MRREKSSEHLDLAASSGQRSEVLTTGSRCAKKAL
jgi:hypothetical protein